MILIASIALALQPPPIVSQLRARGAESLVTTNAPPQFEGRRALLAAAAAAAFAGAPQLAHAETLPLEKFDDASLSFMVPKGWNVAENTLGGTRRLVTIVDPKDTDANVFLAFTPVQGDYGSVGSFGTADYVATTLIPQCKDTSGFAPTTRKCTIDDDGVEGTVRSSKETKGAYVYDYSIKQLGAPERRLRTLFTILDRSFLVTLTAQCPEARYAELGPTYKEVLDSFKFK